MTTNLHRLYVEQRQSPWLDNLTRQDLNDGTLAGLVARGVRGVTANPTIVANAIAGSDAYGAQFGALIGNGTPVLDAYWELVLDDVAAALGVLRPVFEHSHGADGFVSVEVAPGLADDTEATIAAARELHERIGAPNLLVKIPATRAGLPAIRAMIAEGRSINVTLIFSLDRYAEVIEAYLSGLESFVGRGGDPSGVHSVASFFVSRIDTEVDRRLDALSSTDATALRGQAAIAQARLAYRLFVTAFSHDRWQPLALLGARPQRPLWASTSTKDPAYADTRYVDALIGPDTVNTMPEATLEAFADHGTVARTIDAGVADAERVVARLAALGIDMTVVGAVLEDAGVAAFRHSFDSALTGLRATAAR